MNASGPRCTTSEELHALSEDANVAAVVTKSATLELRDGNPEPRWAALPMGGIQSMGLPNLGYLAYSDILVKIRNKDPSRAVIASVSGLSLDDNIKMVNHYLSKPVSEGGFSAIELNLSCPNIPGKPQVGYDFDQVVLVLDAMKQLQIDRPFGLKLPPYFDDSHFDWMAQCIKKYPFVTFITCINSVGNCLVIDLEKEQPVIKPKAGHGGLCGSYVKPIGLANVKNFRMRFGDDFGIIGVGGVEKGTDIYEYLLVGADAVQIGSQFEKEGVSMFQRVHDELVEHMKKKDVKKVSDIRARLKFL